MSKPYPEHIKTYQKISKHVETYHNVSKHINTCGNQFQNTSKHINAYQNISFRVTVVVYHTYYCCDVPQASLPPPLT